MNCNIIKDLIPLCSEGLCSEESENQIKEHIKDCEKCRLLYEHAPQADSTDIVTETPPQKNIFRKVNKKFKRHKIIDIILLLVIAGIIGVLGWLTYGQIAKSYGCTSFETIFQSLEVRKMGEYIAEGDFETYMDYVTNGHIGDIFTHSKIDEMRANHIKTLEETFEKAYGDTKVTDIDVDSTYNQMYADNSIVICSTLTLTFENGKVFSADFFKDVDGLYRAESMWYVAEDDFNAEEEFSNALNFSSWNEVYPLGLVEALIKNENPTKNMLLNKFHLDCQEAIKNGRDSFLEKGFVVDNFFFSRYRFDEDLEMFYYDAAMDASDSQGTAQLRTRIFYDHMGMMAPEKDQVVIYTNGCTPELEEALSTFFG